MGDGLLAWDRDHAEITPVSEQDKAFERGLLKRGSCTIAKAAPEGDGPVVKRWLRKGQYACCSSPKCSLRNRLRLRAKSREDTALRPLLAQNIKCNQIVRLSSVMNVADPTWKYHPPPVDSGPERFPAVQAIRFRPAFACFSSHSSRGGQCAVLVGSAAYSSEGARYLHALLLSTGRNPASRCWGPASVKTFAAISTR